jgi:hypothetical protein
VVRAADQMMGEEHRTGVAKHAVAPAIALLLVCGASCGGGSAGDTDDGADSGQSGDNAGVDSNAGGAAGEVGLGGRESSGGAGGARGGGAGMGSGLAGGGGTSSSTVTCAGADGGSRGMWTDISTAQIAKLGGAAAQSYPGGCSGTAVNRLTGDVLVHIVGFGIWKSTDEGSSWGRIDNNVIDMGGGRCENGWGVQVDQDNPTRIAVFTLDGSAGYTTDGTRWKQWAHAPWGRNWDYGSVDWSSPSAQTIIGVEHEKPSRVVALSTDGGSSWAELTTFDTAGSATAMVGVINANTLIGSKGSGIVRSTDLGVTWTTVSMANPLSHVPVSFNGKFYLTTNAGLLVSADQGLTWKQQGIAIPGQAMLEGPYFGADESSMAVGTNTGTNAFSGNSSIHRTTDGGAHWTKIADAPPSSPDRAFNYAWFGAFSWDPIHDFYYSTRMSTAAFRLDCR